jgi:mono/diheme cytochrome c family protein
LPDQPGGAPGVRASHTPVRPAGKLVWSGSYARHIQPIFDQRCVSCHGESRAENGLWLTGYGAVMKGTQYGPMVVPGSATASNVLAVLRGTADPSIRMPHGGQRLSELELQNIALWIGAVAPDD